MSTQCVTWQQGLRSVCTPLTTLHMVMIVGSGMVLRYSSLRSPISVSHPRWWLTTMALLTMISGAQQLPFLTGSLQSLATLFLYVANHHALLYMALIYTLHCQEI